MQNRTFKDHLKRIILPNGIIFWDPAYNAEPEVEASSKGLIELDVVLCVESSGDTGQSCYHRDALACLIAVDGCRGTV